MNLNVFSAFDGISCGQLALQKAGIIVDNYFASEIDQSAIKITQSNFPNTKQLGDITKIDVKSLPKIDLLIGGSPCQGFSFAGKMLNFNDERSSLFFDFIKLKAKLNPTYFLLENVKMKQEWQDVISNLLGVKPIRINSSLISPTRRDRLYWTNIPNVTAPSPNFKSFDNIMEWTAMNWFTEEQVKKIANWKAQQKPLENATLIGSKGILPVLTARGYNQSHSGMVLIKNSIGHYRYLTNNEAEAAMGLPKDYTVLGTDKQRSHAIGNGWSVDVIAHIFSYLKEIS